MIKISASGVKLYRGCPRRWVFAKVHRLPEPETQATTVGKETHSQLEDWTLRGKVPKSALAASMLKAFKAHPFWPDPRITEAEGAFEFWLDDLHFHGYTDFRRAGTHPDWRVVGDYKTCASFDHALRAEGGLLVDTDGLPDVQAAIYSAREYIEGAKLVTNIWLYGQTKAPHETRLVDVQVDQAKTEAVMRGVCADGHKMVKLATIRPDANDVPFNPGYCLAFRKPCSFASACKKSEHGLFSSKVDPLDVTKHPELDSMDFLSSLKASFPGASLGEIRPNPAQELPPVIDTTAEDMPPPPPEDDDVPPPPPADEPHPAEVLAAAAVDNVPTRDLSAAVESGFINAPEAAGKAPYKNPAEAVAGEGAKAPKGKKATKAKAAADSKGFAITKDSKFDSGTGEPLTVLATGTVDTSDAVLREVYERLKNYFEQR